MLRDLLTDNDALNEGKHWWRQQFDTNEIIVREGERCGNVFVVLRGKVQVTGTVTLENRSIRPGFRTLEVGEVFGELALVDHSPHVASVIGVCPGELAVIPVDTLEEYLEDHPETAARFYRRLAKILSGRLRQTNRKMLSLLGWGLKAHGYERL
ncbi:MAG TPA: cyclic nucleotide-binding domain-containing protein [Methylothermaceae bacterium]|nr:cyclic nucleotide-binding domain-containing protein [Methylothermaceae bacterium]